MKPSAAGSPPERCPAAKTTTISTFDATMTPMLVSRVTRRPSRSTTSTAATTARTENTSTKPCTSSGVFPDHPIFWKMNGL